MTSTFDIMNAESITHSFRVVFHRQKGNFSFHSPWKMIKQEICHQKTSPTFFNCVIENFLIKICSTHCSVSHMSFNFFLSHNFPTNFYYQQRKKNSRDNFQPLRRSTADWKWKHSTMNEVGMDNFLLLLFPIFIVLAVLRVCVNI